MRELDSNRTWPPIDSSTYGRKLDIVRAGAVHEFPVADIEQMLKEIEGGHVGETG